MPGNPTRGLARVTEHGGARQRCGGGTNYRSANWAEQLGQPEHLARVGVVRHRRAQPTSSATSAAIFVDDIENHGNDLTCLHVQQRPAVALTQSLRVVPARGTACGTTPLYAQDQWTIGRMTLQGALRFDRAWSYSPEQTIAPARNFLPHAAGFPETPGVELTRISRRAAASPTMSSATARRREVQLREVPGAREQPERHLLDLQPDRPHCDDDVRTWTDNGPGAGTPDTATSSRSAT